MNILVTGGAGFIGSNFIRYVMKDSEDHFIVNLDKLTYAGNLENLSDIEKEFLDRYVFVLGDICDESVVQRVLSDHKIDVIINFAAETHVDRSIIESGVFIETNIIGTKTLLDAALKNSTSLFMQISTDEVYGSLESSGKFTEDSRISPNSPYAASKAAADHFVRAYNKTYDLPCIITRCSNNYGPYQFPEKLIPLLISNALQNKELPIYGDGKNIRDWIHVDDHSNAVLTVLMKGKTGEVYNIGGDCEKENISIAEEIVKITGRSGDLIKFVKDRPGHDRRYAMDFAKMKNELNWSPSISFNKGLIDTVNWYTNNSQWVDNVKTQEYLKYYDLNYGNR
ncbi:dTDP-glucose 4,6-dehydratase [candidate division KSB1 bacterium]